MGSIHIIRFHKRIFMGRPGDTGEVVGELSLDTLPRDFRMF